MAGRFLQVLDPSAENFTFVLLPESKRDSSQQRPAITTHARFGVAWQRIQQLNTEAMGYGVFVAVNETDSNGRKTENIIRARALFIDADNPETVARAERIVREKRVEPSMRVISSAGRRHFYWLIEGLTLAQFTPLQKAMAECFGSDPHVIDLPRIMRLPGTLHLKGAPQLVSLHMGGETLRYEAAAIVKALGLHGAACDWTTSLPGKAVFGGTPPDNVIPLRRRDAEVSANVAELAAGIEWGWFDALDDHDKDEALRQMLDACADLALGSRAAWIKVLLSAHSSGAPNAEALAREWSCPYPGFTDAEFDQNWESFGKVGSRARVTIGSLIKEATARGFDGSSWRRYADTIRANGRVAGGVLRSFAPRNSTPWDCTQAGALKSTYNNAILAVRKLGVVARRNMFAENILIENEPGSNTLAPDHVGALSDNALAFLRMEILRRFGFDPGADHLLSAVISEAEVNRFNPVVDWLDGLKWDGVKRLDSWLPAITGAADTPLHRSVGRLLVLGMAARARHPGTKFDLCVVFEGPQGSGKSTLARRLCEGPGTVYFGDAPGLIGLEMKARAELLSGKWLVELAELSGLARSESENVKAFLSQAADQFRPAYGRVAVSRLRTCVFVATTNSKTYLQDATGNRRFIPVACGSIDFPALKTIRDQLFAEADAILHQAAAIAAKHGVRVEQGQPLPQEITQRVIALPEKLRPIAAAAAEGRRATDAAEDALPVVLQLLERGAEKLPNGHLFIASADIRAEIFRMTGRPMPNSGFAALMAELGWRQTKKGRAETQVRGYSRS